MFALIAPFMQPRALIYYDANKSCNAVAEAEPPLVRTGLLVRGEVNHERSGRSSW